MSSDLNTFLNKVMTIEISTINRCLDLSRYRQTNDTAEDIELRQLQQYALTEILMFDNVAIQKQLNRMEQIKQRFEKFWTIYLGKVTEFENGTLDEQLFIEKIKGLFIVPKFPDGHITQDFIFDLHDAIMYKDGYLLGFMEQVKNSQQAPDPPAPDQEPRPVKNFIAHLTMDENKKQPFADEIKKQFPGIGGKELALLIQAMLKHEPPLIQIEGRGKAQLYKSLREFFGWDIKADKNINAGFIPNHGDSERITTYQKTISTVYKSIK